MPYKDPEKRKAYKKEWRETHKNEIKEYQKEYDQKPEAIKLKRIYKWKHRGVIFHDYDLLHDIYISTTHCHFCKCLLNQCSKSLKCVDHDHDIHDNENVRGIVCSNCNLNIIK